MDKPDANRAGQQRNEIGLIVAAQNIDFAIGEAILQGVGLGQFLRELNGAFFAARREVRMS